MSRAGRRMLGLVVLLLALLPGTLAAQQRPEQPLEPFLEQVLRSWRTGDAGALASLAPEGGRITLDIGEGRAEVGGRHAAAALRAMFGNRETLAVRPLRATLAGGDPPRGFGELAWQFRLGGVPAPQVSQVYVGAVWERRGWRLSEIRIIR